MSDVQALPDSNTARWYCRTSVLIGHAAAQTPGYIEQWKKRGAAGVLLAIGY
jgi:hypothetical protein